MIITWWLATPHTEEETEEKTSCTTALGGEKTDFTSGLRQTCNTVQRRESVAGRQDQRGFIPSHLFTSHSSPKGGAAPIVMCYS